MAKVPEAVLAVIDIVFVVSLYYGYLLLISELFCRFCRDFFDGSISKFECPEPLYARKLNTCTKVQR